MFKITAEIFKAILKEKRREIIKDITSYFE